jgi:beta-lactamase regulating signal transducer with metallopeptidase domain
MSSLVQTLGWVLLHFLWQGLVLAGATALVLALLRGRDSRLRYAVACSGMLLMLAAPPVTWAALTSAPARPVAAGARAAGPAAPAASAAPALRTPGRNRLVRVLPWLVLAWAAGTAAMSLRLAGGWVWLQWLRRRRETLPASDAHQLSLLRLCQRMGVGSNLRLLLCASVPGPTLLGWLRPVILIPPALVTGLSPQQLEFILAHELAHVLRHDYLVNLVQSLAEVLLFFHPAVWWLSARIRQEREQASDDLVVRFHGDALDYAHALTVLQALALRIPSAHPSPRLALGAQGGDFMFRIRRLISPAPTPFTLMAPRAGLLGILLLAAAGAGLHAHPRPAQATEQNAPEALPKGTVVLRRFDADSPDGHARAGTIDFLAHSVTRATMERAFATVQKLPANPAAVFAQVEVPADPSEHGAIFTFKFTGVDPARVLSIIRAYDAFEPVPKRKGMLVIQRMNSFTQQGALLPKGLLLDAWAGEIPADIVLQALNELEAMAPQAGIPQEIRREIPAGMGKGPTVQLDLSQADPIEVRGILEKVMGQGKP